MNKFSIIESIKKEKTFLQKEFGVEEIAIFGSYARGEESAGSDLDLLVSLKQPSYSLFAGLYLYLENILGTKVDIIRKGPHLSERFLSRIHKDLIYV